MNSEEEILTLYVQYVSIKKINVGSTVQFNEKIIGRIEQIDQNFDAFILKLAIDSEIHIPMLSKFRIKTDQNINDFIDIELSDSEKILKDKEFFIGEE